MGVITIWVENPRNLENKTRHSELINKISKVTEYKIDTQKSNFSTLHGHEETKIYNSVPFTTAPQNMRHTH